MSSSPLKKSKLEKFTEEYKKSFSVPKHPRHCPDCGSKVSTVNLNFKEAIFICSSTLNCVWPLGGTHQPHEILGIRDSKLQAQIRLEKTTRKKSRLFWNEGKENIPSLQVKFFVKSCLRGIQISSNMSVVNNIDPEMIEILGV